MRFLKIGGVIFGALLITTLGISASDTLTGKGDSLLGQLAGSDSSACGPGMIAVPTGSTFSCVDMYEASPSKECPISAMSSTADTQSNLNETTCSSQSAVGMSPWTHISRDQAELVCRRSGKRLPTAAEWHHVAIGTPDQVGSCNISGSSVARSGASKDCVSALGGYDFVGNAWEWVSDDVFDGMYNGRPLPTEGYVTQTTNDGVAVATAGSPSGEYAADYFWSEQTGVYGMLRGGYFGSKSDAGVYAIQARTVPTAATQAIGFRCVI